MASCKDCVHVEVCSEYVEGLAAVRGLKLGDVEGISAILQCDDCDHFKDRSRFVELPTHLNVSERFEKCSQELINIAKCSETPSRILRILGENFTELANGFEAVERKAEQALKERQSNGQSQN